MNEIISTVSWGRTRAQVGRRCLQVSRRYSPFAHRPHHLRVQGRRVCKLAGSEETLNVSEAIVKDGTWKMVALMKPYNCIMESVEDEG